MNHRARCRTPRLGFHSLKASFSPVALACCLWAAVIAPTPAAGPVEVPGQEQVLNTLRKDHPRLLITPMRLDGIRTQLAEQREPMTSWFKELRDDANDLLKAPPSKYEIPDGLRLLSTSRRVLQRIETLGLVYLLETNKAHLDRAWLELEAAANFTNWNPRHFLDTAEMTRAFAEGYDWMYHAWTPEQRKVLVGAIVKHGFEPALSIYRGKRGWARAHHNWNQVCNGGMGMGALAVGDVEPELSRAILHSALESLPLAMKEFAPDGAWNEGPGYWSYATAYNVAILDALDTALGTDFGLSQIEGFSETGLFPIYITGATGRTFNYADGGDHGIQAPQISWFGGKFHQPVLGWHHRQPHSASALDLLWFCDQWRTPEVAKLPLDRYFRAAEVVTMRSAWQDRRAWFVGFKAGDNKANHSHLDLGSFVLDQGGVRWGTDLGAENYNLPGYFGNQRWTYYRLRAEGNNTLVINPGAEPDQDPTAATTITQFKTSADKAFAIADLTPAYAKRGVEAVHRGVGLFERKSVLIQDEIKAATPAEVWWFMHTSAEIKVNDAGDGATLRERDRTLHARIISPVGARFDVLPATPLPTSPNPEKQNPNATTRKLAVHLKGIQKATLAIKFSDEPVSAAAVVPLSDW